MARVRDSASSSRAKAVKYARRLFGAAGVLLAGVYVAQVLSHATLTAPAPTPVLTDRHGVYLAQAGHEENGASGRYVNYGYWPVDPIPDRVARAALGLEDRRFWWHPGVDPVALVRAAWQNVSAGRRVSGASTIAMQIARMQNPQARTLWAKAVEAGTAVALTLRYSRQELLAHYLRLVPYGNGSHGIAHAARWYFDKPVGDLGWAEIALLSALPQAPTLNNPTTVQGLMRAVRRAGQALDELARQGEIPADELAVARMQLAQMRPLHAPRRPDAYHAILRLRDMVARDGARDLDPRDPRVRTRLDLGIQRQVTQILRQQLQEWRGAGAQQVAAMVVQRRTREVLAAVGSSGYGEPDGGAIDFTRVERSPGSTLKPFIYALALEGGLLDPATVLGDMPEGSAGIGNIDGRFLGPLLPRQALANSRNVPATNLLRRVGVQAGFDFLRTLNLHDQNVPAEDFGLSMVIGALPTSMDRLLYAYGALAEDGMLAELDWYQGAPRAPPRRVLSERTARQITHFLADPLARMPSFPRYGATEYPFAVALKTGTSQGYRDAWTVAWSQDYMVAVWMGRADAGTMVQMSGGRAAAAMAQAILLHLHESTPGDLLDTQFPPPAGMVQVELCAFTGLRNVGACNQTFQEYVEPDNIPPPEPVHLADDRVTVQRVVSVLPDYRSWAAGQGFLVRQDAISAEAPVRLSITAPEREMKFWRNPEAPAQLNRLALRVVTEPRVPQVVWYVDGVPFMLADPDKPVYWPMTQGEHRFQVRLPHRPERSGIVRVVIE